MTHLFADGGRIVKSTRTDYSEHLECKEMVAIVKNMMKEQHKAMFVALRSGELDDLIGFEEAAPPASVVSPDSVLGRAADLLEVREKSGFDAKARPTPGAAAQAEPKPTPPRVSDSEKAYAASRPAAIFSVPPPSNNPNIFGQVGLDEKSLDDAILSYLAEEPALEGGSDKDD
jgi:hypothetical protein